MHYPAQLKHKKDLIKESLKKYTELDRSQIKIDQIIGMNQKNVFKDNKIKIKPTYKVKNKYNISKKEYVKTSITNNL